MWLIGHDWERLANPGLSFALIGWTARETAIQVSEFALVRWTGFALVEWTGARKHLKTGGSRIGSIMIEGAEVSPVNDRKKSTDPPRVHRSSAKPK